MDIKTIGTGSKGNCYVITSPGNRQLLLECGVKWEKVLDAFSYEFRYVVGCLLTHEHGDHSKSVEKVLYNTIPVMCSHGTAEALKIDGNPRVWELKPKQLYAYNDFGITGYPAIHDAAEPFMYVIRDDEDTLLFATDTAYIPYKFKNLTKIMVECNYSFEYANESLANGSIVHAQKSRIKETHMEIGTLEAWLQDLKEIGGLDKLKEIHLIHMSSYNGYPEEFMRRIEAVSGVPVYVKGEKK